MKTASKFGHVFPGWPLAMIFILVFCSLQAQTASWQWAERFGSSWGDVNAVSVDDRPLDMEVDADGNVYIVGLVLIEPEFNDSIYPYYGNYDVFLCSYDCEGNFRWAQIMGKKNQYDDYDYSIAIDGRGNIYLTGVIDASPWSSKSYFHIGDTVIDFQAGSAFIAKFKQDDGRFEWVRVMNDPNDILYSTTGLEIAVHNNRLYVVIFSDPGELEPGIQVPYSLIMGIYDTSGNYINHFIIAKPIGNALVSGIAGLYLTPDNDLVMGGYLSGKWDFGDTVAIFGDQVFIVKYDTVGNMKWFFKANGTNAFFKGMDIDNKGNIYICGSAANAIFGTDTLNVPSWNAGFPYYLKINEQGVQWYQVPDKLNAVAQLNDIIYLKNTYATGYIIGQQTWDTIVVNSVGNGDPVFMQIDQSGKAISIDNIPGSGDWGDEGRLLASDSVGNVYMSGTFENELAFGNDTVYNSGGYTDIFVAKYGTAICVDTATGTGTMPHKITGKVLLRPNPFASTAVLQLMLPAGYRPVSRPVVSVYGLTGRWLYSVQMYETGPGIWQAAMHRKGLPAGLYIYQITAGNEAVAQGKFSIQFE
jgi:beta-propeller repeat-containing protein